MDYAIYFLIVSDYIKWAKKKLIPVGYRFKRGSLSLKIELDILTDSDSINMI